MARKQDDSVTKAPSVAELEAAGTAKKPKKDQVESFDASPKGVGLRVALVTSFIWLALISLFIMAVVFDPTEDAIIRTPVLLFFNPDENALDEYIEGRIGFLQDWERELYETEQELEEDREEIDLWKDQLNELELELDEREARIDEIIGALEDIPGGGGAVDFEKLARDIAAMQPANAAALLEELDVPTAAAICRHITSRRMGPIFDHMEPNNASAILAEMTEDLSIMDPSYW